MGDVAAIILAAGKSTRMRSGLAKVLHEVCGLPMLGFALSACRLAGLDRLIVVVGHHKDEVIRRFATQRDVTWVEQSEQKGTAHALLCCRDALAGFVGSVLVLAGDMPLVRREVLMELVEARKQSGAAMTLATSVLENPSGYGRIVRDAGGDLESLVEDRNCTPQQREIREVNPSYYCFDAQRLFPLLERIEPNPVKGEYYLTDVVGILCRDGRKVSATIRVPPEEAMGINSRGDLATVGRIMQDRIQHDLLEEGVTIVDPGTTWIEAEAAVGPDTTIHPFTFVGAGATIGAGCRIGPFARIGKGETVAEGTIVAPGASTGKEV